MRERRGRYGDLQWVAINLVYHGRPVSLRLDQQPAVGWSWAWSTPHRRGYLSASGTAPDEATARRDAFASLRQSTAV